MTRPRTSVVTPGTARASLSTPRPQGYLLAPGVCEYASTVFTVAPGAAALLTGFNIPRGGHVAVVAVDYDSRPVAGGDGCCCATPADATLVIRSSNTTPWYLNPCNSTAVVTTPGAYRLVLVAPTEPAVVAVTEQQITLAQAAGVQALCDCPPMCLTPDGCGAIRFTVPPGFQADVQFTLDPQTGLNAVRDMDCETLPVMRAGAPVQAFNSGITDSIPAVISLDSPGDYRLVTTPVSVCQTAVVTLHCKCCR